MKHTNVALETNTLYLDQTSQRLAVAYTLRNSSLPPLALSKKLPWRVAANSLRCTLSGAPSVNLRAMIGASENRILWDATEVVFGISVDPFQDGLPALGEALKSIEYILTNRPKKLLIQTRSPLILLATPLIRSAKTVEVRLALETVDDEVARRFLPHLPRPSERLIAAEALGSLGLSKVLQVSPIIPKHLGSERVESFVRRLNKLPQRKSIRPVESLLTDRVETPLQLLSRSQHLLLVQAERILAHELAKFGEEPTRARA